MKNQILSSSAALLLAVLPAARAQQPPPPPVEPKETHSATASSTVTADGSGTVTVEVDVNGKKERKTFKLGDGPFTWKIEENGAQAGGAARVGQLLRAGRDLLGKHEKVTWLGLAAEPVGDDVRAQLPLQAGEGLAVRHVMPDSPAAKAGLTEHDILTRFDDQILVSSDQLKALVQMHKPGDSVKLSYLRKSEKGDATVTLAEHDAEAEPDVVKFMRGPDGKFNLDWNNGPERMKEMEDRLRAMKERLPGIIVDKKSFLIGPDGILKKLDGKKLEEQIQENIENLRKELEKAQISPEDREQIRQKVESALRNAKEAVEKAEDAVKKAQDPKLAPPAPEPKLEEKQP